MVEAGTVLGGKYRLRALLGEGGMGAVWIADNLAIKGAEVAVKVLHAHFARETETVQRFRQEAEAARGRADRGAARAATPTGTAAARRRSGWDSKAGETSP